MSIIPTRIVRGLIIVCLLVLVTALQAASLSFANFDQRAKHGDRLKVVFFGASLTWGANASDQAYTSYRAYMARYLENKYPKAHFTFYDAAIGGTGSQLAVFRLNRDVLQRHPDLVFLDFSANDDICSDTPETLASYESLVRRIIQDGQAPVIQMIFPFGWNIGPNLMEKMKRRDAHLAISKAYRTGVGDAIALINELAAAGKTTKEKVWPYDFAHPGDYGYSLFAQAAQIGYEDSVKRKLVCTVPEKMLNSETYMRNSRVRISSLGTLPKGWSLGHPNLTSAWHDGLMCRWLDDEVIASNIKKNDKGEKVPQSVERFKCRVNGSMVMLFGEKTLTSGKYRIYFDGKLYQHTPWGSNTPLDEFDAYSTVGGNVQLAEVIISNLDPSVTHLMEIEPVFAQDKAQELRIESICVAGGNATVQPAQ